MVHTSFPRKSAYNIWVFAISQKYCRNCVVHTWRIQATILNLSVENTVVPSCFVVCNFSKSTGQKYFFCKNLSSLSFIAAILIVFFFFEFLVGTLGPRYCARSLHLRGFFMSYNFDSSGFSERSALFWGVVVLLCSWSAHDCNGVGYTLRFPRLSLCLVDCAERSISSE